jgi:hypothetical protein
MSDKIKPFKNAKVADLGTMEGGGGRIYPALRILSRLNDAPIKVVGGAGIPIFVWVDISGQSPLQMEENRRAVVEVV